MWGSTQMPTTSHRHTAKLEPLGVDHSREDFPDDTSVASTSAQRRPSRRPRRLGLPPSSQQAQYARRLEIEAIEAKKRFTRELLQQHHILLETHAKAVHEVKADGPGASSAEHADGACHACGDDKATIANHDTTIAGQGDGNKSVPEVVHVRSRKKKKKRKRKKERQIKPQRKMPLTVDTSKARSSLEVLRICLNELGWFWKEYCTNRRVPCDLYWHACGFYDNERLPPGKVNKFPGLSELVRKAQLSKLLHQMQQLFPTEYEFYPKTWLLPEQYHQFCADVEAMHEKNPNHSPIFIVKPDMGSKGEGIYLINDPHKMSNIGLVRPAVVQEYVSKPLLLERTKFDLRVYVLLASIEPLQVYICREGMARFCTMKYQEPTTQNLHQVYMHLTNYSLNKHSDSFVHHSSGDRGSKRTMSSAFASLANRGHDTPQLWEDIEELVIKTITAILPDLKVAWQAEITVNKMGPTCFQILGFDIIVTNQMKPILLEVNSSPSMRLDFDHEISPSVYEILPSPVDEEIKIPLIKDILRLIKPGPIGRPRSATSSTSSYTDDLSDSRSDVSTPEPMSEDEEDPLHDSCLVEIWPRKFSERYEELRIIERVARLYGIFLGVRGAQRMGATAFRTFSRRCKLSKGSLSMASIDIMYIDVTRRWNMDLPEGTAGGMVFGGFLEAFFLIARTKAKGDTLLEKVSRLVDHCECNLNEGMLAIPKKGGRKLRRPEMGHYKFRRLGPLDS